MKYIGHLRQKPLSTPQIFSLRFPGKILERKMKVERQRERVKKIIHRVKETLIYQILILSDMFKTYFLYTFFEMFCYRRVAICYSPLDRRAVIKFFFFLCVEAVVLNLDQTKRQRRKIYNTVGRQRKKKKKKEKEEKGNGRNFFKMARAKVGLR